MFRARFVVSQKLNIRLSEFEAYYLAHALVHRDVIAKHRDDPQVAYAAKVMLWFLAADSVKKTHHSEFRDVSLMIYGKGRSPLESVFDYYLKQDFWMCAKFGDFVEKELRNIAGMLSGGGVHVFHVVNSQGKAKLMKEWPEICNEMGIK